MPADLGQTGRGAERQRQQAGPDRQTDGGEKSLQQQTGAAIRAQQVVAQHPPLRGRAGMRFSASECEDSVRCGKAGLRGGRLHLPHPAAPQSR